MPDEAFTIRKLGPQDIGTMHGMLSLFGKVFDEPHVYDLARPDDKYLEDLLYDETFIAVAALQGDEVIGALAAYQLRKFEQRRSEVYIYDLAVAEEHRRRGVATAMIREVQMLAAERGGWVVYVQADYVDEPAVALYTKLGTREEVLHFDLPVLPRKPSGQG